MPGVIAPGSRPSSRAAASIVFRLAWYCPGAILVGSHPSPRRPVSSSIRGPWAASQTGGGAAPAGPSPSTARRRVKNLPSKSTGPSARQRSRMTSMPSASRATGLSQPSP